MRKYLIESQLQELAELKATTLNAQEDLELYKLVKTLRKEFAELNEDKKALAEQATKDGVVFGEDGQPDLEKSDKDALAKTNEKFMILINEEFETKVLSIELLNKLKVENELVSAKYQFLLDLYLKDE